MEEGVLTHPETGVVQGGGLSPIRANICLNHVLDAWCEQEVRPRMKGRGFLIRFADDLVIGGELAGEARRIMAVLPKRFARFGLRIHPTKTARVTFRKPAARQGTDPGNGTFACLGLTHSWSRSRRGFGVIQRRTARQRLCRTKKSLWRGCHTNRHAPLPYQYHMLCLKLRGHFRYYGIRGNCRLLEDVRRYAEKAWRYWLSRRSSKSPTRWEKFQKLRATDILPTPKIVHNIGLARQGSTVMCQRSAETVVTEEPYAFIAHVRVWGGGQVGNHRLYPEADAQERAAEPQRSVGSGTGLA